MLESSITGENMAKSKIEPQNGMKPINNHSEATHHIQQLLKFSDQFEHPPEVTRMLLKTIGIQYNLTDAQIDEIIAGRKSMETKQQEKTDI